MTKYVLNSGGLRNNPKKGKEFLDEIIKGLGSKPKMLLTLFAQPREYWEKKFEQHQNELNDRTSEDLEISFELAFPDTFKDQIQNNDIVYIHGGDDYLTKYWFKQFDLPVIWENKVIATSSAGSNVLTMHYWTCDWRKCMDGLGILPIKFIPHYKSEFGSDDPRGPIDWETAHKELEEYGDKSLPIHALEEGSFIVIEK